MLQSDSEQSTRRAWLAGQEALQQITSEIEDAAFEWTCRYGSGNGWAGSSGQAAGFIRALLIECERLRREQANSEL